MLTVLIPCKDERHNILDCIDSVRDIADEILVADSGSTDGTLELVRDLPGVRVIEREYVNSADFKNWAIPQATYEWVLLVDSDERVTMDVALSIGKALAEPGDHEAFAVRRDTYMLGHRLRYSGAQSATCIRLFRRHLRYHPRRVHADIDVAADKTGILDGKLEHHTCQCLNRFMQTQNRYSTWAALDAFDAGKRASFWSLALRPPMKFMQFYFIRLGILDRTPGLMWCGIVAYYNLMKYAKLWELSHSSTKAAQYVESPSDNLPQATKSKKAA
ncbi:glycosyltransferase family 2 protein [Aeoliella sp. ICT_H6.2]|uniref:Glycosyltransferase family 2 protein n=1 Tax=Aeoliella straminimaris TaxID=2954799 RepID=A0A9X2F6K6_9BACT|nr:glycosyltransferase family 2 protein [Aeoliella straminimaris]MCO6042588.1 glycosyltransferase family 2 protein [Aeoliella straminimaris]